MEYGLIGERLPHSFSKEIHALCGDYAYALTELTPEEIPSFLQKKDFRGINVTIPYKQTVIPFLDAVDEAASAIGAVNTVVNREGRLYGYNTDFYGMQALLRHAKISLSGKKVLILGSGGTAKTARAVATAGEARCVFTVGRTKARADLTYEEAYASHADCEILINTTPCGMYPYGDGTSDRAAVPADLSFFPRLCGVIDAVYNPLRTNLILEARSRGIPAEGGLYMLVAQGVLASRLFRGQDREGLDEETDGIFARIAAQKENIVLIGMPASGKTTVGKLLSDALNRPFFDTDEEIVRGAGKEISRIFAEKGEKVFRDLETKAVVALANEKTGCVIATGGGAVLREENLRALRRTGRIYFLDRPLQALLPTPDRPLASTKEAVEARYRERYPLYLAACHVKIDGSGTAEETAQAVRKDFEA